MNTTTIRRFRVAYEQYRHVINLDTDEVFLQRYNDSAETPEDEWESLLRFDPHCGAWDAKTNKSVGHFRIQGSHWMFHDASGVEVRCEDSAGVESLLDSEVTISKRWLMEQAIKGQER